AAGTESRSIRAAALAGAATTTASKLSDRAVAVGPLTTCQPRSAATISRTIAPNRSDAPLAWMARAVSRASRPTPPSLPAKSGAPRDHPALRGRARRRRDSEQRRRKRADGAAGPYSRSGRGRRDDGVAEPDSTGQVERLRPAGQHRLGPEIDRLAGDLSELQLAPDCRRPLVDGDVVPARLDDRVRGGQTPDARADDRDTESTTTSPEHSLSKARQPCRRDA